MNDKEMTVSEPSVTDSQVRSAAQLQVPVGWKLVPALPTVAMHNAAAMAGLCGKPPAFSADGRLEWALADASAVYLAMVAAAPNPPAPADQAGDTRDAADYDHPQYKAGWNDAINVAALYVAKAGLAGNADLREVHSAILRLAPAAAPLLGYLVTEEGGQFVDFIMPEDREGIAAYQNAAGVTMTEVVGR